MVKLRRFVTLDGEVTAEEEWPVKPTDKCFYCDSHLITTQSEPCPVGFLGRHDFVTLVDRDWAA